MFEIEPVSELKLMQAGGLMKVVIPAEILEAILKAPVKASEENKTLQILTHVYLSAKDGKLVVVGANPEYSVSSEIKTNVVSEGETLVLGEKLLKIVKAFPKTEILMELNENLLDVYTEDGNIKFSLQTLSVEEYPRQIIESVSVDPFCSLAQSELKKGLKKVSKFSSDDDTINPVFSGILFDFRSDNVLRLVATDTKRMGVFRINYSGDAVNERFVIPSDAADVLEDVLGGEGPVDIGVVKDEDGNVKNVLFVLEGVKISTSVIAGNFPDYERIIPQNLLNVATLNVRTLSDALKRISLIVDKETNRVSFEFDETVLRIKAVNNLLGSGSEVIPCKFSGAPDYIHFNYEFVDEFLDVVDGEVFYWGFNEVEGPSKFWSSEDENFLYVAMPLRRG